MAKWVKVLLGIIVSVGIFVGILAWVYDMHLMQDPSLDRQIDACFDTARYRGSDSDECVRRYRTRFEEADRNDQLLAAGIGAASTGLFWLLAYQFYIKPRRRRTGLSPPA